VVWGSVAIAAIVVLCIRYKDWKVNGLISAANKFIDQGSDLKKGIGPDADQLYMGRTPPAYDRAKLEKSVADTTELLKQIAEDYRAAAAKFDEASRAGKDEKTSKYFQLMSQANEARAKAEDLRGKAVALLLDKSIKSPDDLHKQCGALMNDARKAEGEFDRLEEGARKLRGAD